MKILILGGAGMLGHKVHAVMAKSHQVTSTVRARVQDLPVDPNPFLSRGQVIEGVDATDLSKLEDVLDACAPAALINCVGVIKQREAATDPLASISVNALLPHQLAGLCHSRGVRFIHISTDCVFDGARGDYGEGDPTDARDLYGRTKALGEVGYGDSLTIRTSMIGRELAHFRSLLEWFLRSTGVVRGFTQAVYSGVTTFELALIIRRILEDHPDLSGLYHVASEKLTKFELLSVLRDAFSRTDVTIEPDATFVCDRSLRGDRFREATGISPPAWSKMAHELARDATAYRERDR